MTCTRLYLAQHCFMTCDHFVFMLHSIPLCQLPHLSAAMVVATSPPPQQSSSSTTAGIRRR